MKYEGTERVIASFEPSRWREVCGHLRNRAGVKRVAHIKHFLRKPAHAHHEPVLMIKELGLAMIQPRRAGTDRTARTATRRHANARRGT